MAFLPRRIEQTWSNEILHPGEQSLKLLENLSTSQSEFEAMRRPQPQDHPETSVRARCNARLTADWLSSSRDAAAVMLFSSANRGKCNQEVQVDLSQFL